MITLNPLPSIGLESLDFGDILSPDGRAHPVTANTPATTITFDPQLPTLPQTPPIVGRGTAGTPQSPASTGPATPPSSVVDMLANWAMPKHFGARLVIGIVAIGLILLVAFRLLR